MKKNQILFICLIWLIASCKQDNQEVTQPAVTQGNLSINMGYRFDNTTLLFDTIGYTNAAGYEMSVSRLQFYLSNFVLYKADGGTYPVNQAIYFDAKDVNFKTATFKNIPVGLYSGISFYLGLDTSTNKSNALPFTAENINMGWPDPMGGGYHFLKLEGNFIDSANTWGYAMHLGRNTSLVTIPKLNKPFTIGANPAGINLTMNVSEWFKNPAIFDFNKDGVFIMGIDSAMTKFKLNGSDVFND